MDRSSGTNIWLNRGEKEELEEGKRAVERHYRKRFDWGAFLVGLATGAVSAAIVAEAISGYRRRREEEQMKKRGGDK